MPPGSLRSSTHLSRWQADRLLHRRWQGCDRLGLRFVRRELSRAGSPSVAGTGSPYGPAMASGWRFSRIAKATSAFSRSAPTAGSAAAADEAGARDAHVPESWSPDRRRPLHRHEGRERFSLGALPSGEEGGALWRRHLNSCRLSHVLARWPLGSLLLEPDGKGRLMVQPFPATGNQVQIQHRRRRKPSSALVARRDGSSFTSPPRRDRCAPHLDDAELHVRQSCASTKRAAAIWAAQSLMRAFDVMPDGRILGTVEPQQPSPGPPSQRNPGRLQLVRRAEAEDPDEVDGKGSHELDFGLGTLGPTVLRA